MTIRDTDADAASLHRAALSGRTAKAVDRSSASGPGMSPDVWELIWNYRRLIGVFIAASIAVAVAVAFLMTPVYRSSVLLMPTESNSRMGMLGGLLGQVGGIGALADLGIGGGGRNTTVESLALLQSRQFIEDFIQAHGIMPILFQKDWNASQGRWKRSVRQPPTLWKGYKIFTNSVLDVYHDEKTDLVTLNVDWTDRNTAAKWANQLVDALNNQVRGRAITEADQTIQYLETQIKSADTVELRQALYAMLENQVKIRALAMVRKQYAFRVLDPAAPADPDNKLRPKKALYIAVAPFVGMALGLLVATLVDGRRRYRGEHRVRP